MKNAALVLATINAPHSEKLDGDALTNCLLNQTAAKEKPGHMSAFFGEVAPEDQKGFAALFGIPEATLIDAAKAFARYSGESYPLAA